MGEGPRLATLEASCGEGPQVLARTVYEKPSAVLIAVCTVVDNAAVPPKIAVLATVPFTLVR